MDPTLYTDPNVVIKLGRELQKRIGLLPVVEMHAFHLESQPGEIVRVLRVQPQSYSEIARVVRAARTMKLTVRGCGDRTGGDIGIYGTSSTVLIDCGLLADSPRLEFVKVIRKNETEEIPGLRVLACVGIHELVQFQIHNQIEIAQSVETTSKWGTVVGTITSSAPGIVGPGGFAQGGCLSDEVLSVRIVDCHGDLIQYSTKEEISAALSTLGILGIVYDVTLRYSPLSLTRVDYKFMKWAQLLNPENDLLQKAVEEKLFTELIYLPYNSCELEEEDSIEIPDWAGINDEVIIRTGKHLGVAVSPEKEDPAIVNSSPRQLVYLIDQVFGPETKEFITKISKTPWLLGRAHHHLRCRFQPEPSQVQYTPWAINSLGKMVEPVRTLRFTLETDRNLKEFKQAMEVIFALLEDLAHGGPRYRKNYAMNLGVRVHFTDRTKTGRLLGVGFDSGAEKFNENTCGPEFVQFSSNILAHITFVGITAPGPSTLWTRAANHTTNVILRSIPKCIPQWRSEWYGISSIIQRFKEMLGKHTEPLKELAALADRDGVFLNELMSSILYPTPTFYQKLYITQRIDALTWITQDPSCLIY